MASDEVIIDQKTTLIPAVPNPFIFFGTKIISLQAEIISTCILNLASPFLSIISLVSSFLFRRTPAHEFPDQNDRESEPDFSAAARGGGGGSILLWRVASGLLAAAYVFVVLMVVMVAAAVLGVGLVRAWAEEPVYVREGLQFDYSEAHPTAVFYFGNKAAAAAGVPVGHTLYVSLLLLMPESDYNRDLGIFQANQMGLAHEISLVGVVYLSLIIRLTVELISVEGNLVAKSSHPCMIRFRSWPIRLTRTFLMSVPLLLGITTETQTITLPMLKHKEASYPRTEYTRITLTPRAGTASLPQFYNAEVVVKSRPPWTRELVHRWKWTFCVWTALYIFVVLVMILVFFLKPVIFPIMAIPFAKYKQDPISREFGVVVGPELFGSNKPRDGNEVSESIRRWQSSRSKRKAALLRGSESARSSAATSITGVSFEEGSGDSSESVCFRGEG
ncbi:hypothetical protein OROMI_001792 [Orobanche minor]